MSGSRLLAGLLATVATIAQAQVPPPQWRTMPAAPSAGEPFVVQYDGPGGGQVSVTGSSAQLQGSSLVLRIDLAGSFFATAGFPIRGSAVAVVPDAGSYMFSMIRAFAVPDSPVTLGTIAIGPSVGPAAPAFRNLSGNWFDPAQSGSGFNIVQGDSGQLFAVWLTYAPEDPPTGTTGQPGRWLVMPAGRWISPTEFRGILYDTTGPSISASFDPSLLAVVPVGFADLRFADAQQVEFSAQVGYGTQGTVVMSLLPVIDKHATLHRFQF